MTPEGTRPDESAPQWSWPDHWVILHPTWVQGGSETARHRAIIGETVGMVNCNDARFTAWHANPEGRRGGDQGQSAIEIGPADDWNFTKRHPLGTLQCNQCNGPTGSAQAAMMARGTDIKPGLD
jgi:hypothetical protein